MSSISLGSSAIGASFMSSVRGSSWLQRSRSGVSGSHFSMFVVISLAISAPSCSSGTAMSAVFLVSASLAIFSSVWTSTSSLSRLGLEKSCSGSLLRSVCLSAMNFAHSSSVAASSLSSCLSFSVKSSTGFLARLSVASITFFCCLRNSASLSFRSLSLLWTSEGSSVPGFFFSSASRLSVSRLTSFKSRRRTSMIRSCVAVSSAVGLGSSVTDFT